MAEMPMAWTRVNSPAPLRYFGSTSAMLASSTTIDR